MSVYVFDIADVEMLRIEIALPEDCREWMVRSK